MTLFLYKQSVRQCQVLTAPSIGIAILFLYFWEINKNRHSSLLLHTYTLTYICKHRKNHVPDVVEKKQYFLEKIFIAWFLYCKHVRVLYVCYTVDEKQFKKRKQTNGSEFVGTAIISLFCARVVCLILTNCVTFNQLFDGNVREETGYYELTRSA